MFVSLLMLLLVVVHSLWGKIYVKYGTLTIDKNLNVKGNLTVIGTLQSMNTNEVSQRLMETKMYLELQQTRFRLLHSHRAVALASTTWLPGSPVDSLRCALLRSTLHVVCHKYLAYGAFSLQTNTWTSSINTASAPATIYDAFVSMIYPDGSEWLVSFGGEEAGYIFKNHMWHIQAKDFLDVTSNWTSVPYSPAVTPRSHLYATFYKGRMWFHGGYDNNPLDRTYSYNPNSQTFSDIGNFMGPKRYVSVVGTKDHVYFIGGKDSGSNALTSVTKFGSLALPNPIFIPLASLSSGRMQGSVFAVGGSIYLFHGYEGSSSTLATTNLRYSLSNDQWSTVTVDNQPSSRMGSGYIQWDSLCLIVSGVTSGVTMTNEVFSIVL